MDPNRSSVNSDKKFQRAMLKSKMSSQPGGKASIGELPNEVVAEVLEGEETPLFRRDGKTASHMRNYATMYSNSREIAQPLFPYPEYSTTGLLSSTSDFPKT